MWGTTNKVDSAEQCCAQCAAYKPQSEDDIYCNGARPSVSAVCVLGASGVTQLLAGVIGCCVTDRSMLWMHD